MKRLILFLPVLLLWAFIPSENTLDLHQAIKSGQLTASASSTGDYSGNSIQLQVKNLSGKKQTLLVPAGTLFKAVNEAEQDIIVVTDQQFALSPNSTNNLNITGYCSQSSDQAPDEGNGFTISKSTHPGLLAFSKTVHDKRYADEVLQEAVWVLTDDHSLSYVSGGEEGESDELRKVLADITGKEIPWYETTVERSITADRRILGRAVEVSGDVVYQAKKGDIVTTEVWGPDGTMLFNMGEGRPAPFDGRCTFGFRLELEGYPTGTYSVKVLKDGRTILSNQFFEV